MEIHLDARDSAPVYVQIVRQVKRLLASGRLAAGDEMPSVRVLARQLLVNPNTVARAYRELEVLGVLESRQGSGTYVSGEGGRPGRRRKVMCLAAPADALLREARGLGVPLEEVREFLIERDAVLDADDERSA